jgi:pyruvate dehydrogenase E2 component (dihydrolipoamide acetyltransferase)
LAEVRDVLVPDIGDFSDVPVVEVLVSKGDRVAKEDPLVTLESEKASMDVPAPFAGVVDELKVDVGDTVSEGTPLLSVLVEGDGGDGGEPAAAEEEEAAGKPEVAEAAPRAPAPAGNGAAPEVDQRQPASASAVYAGPGARRRGRELGVDLSRLTGTGRKGRVVIEDVERASRAPAAPAGGGIGGIELPPWPKVDFEKYGPVERQPLPKIKQIAGPNLQRNWITIPHVTHHDEADITELEAFRVRSNKELAEQGVKLTMVALLLEACVASLKEFPEFNASLDGDSLVLKRYYNLGFAADTPQGLMVPVIRDVDKKDLTEIAGELKELSGKAREGKLGPAEMSGGTFTISSLGGIGGTGFTPIVNAPEVAILGVTRSQMKPVWNGTEFDERLMLPLSLSYDHRVIDGAAAARFCVHLSESLSDMRPGFA